MWTSYSIFPVLFLFFLALTFAEQSCKCVSSLPLCPDEKLTLEQTPNDACWPSLEIWNSLNASVSGKLIRNTPPALSCYPGPYYNEAECAYVYSQWSNSSFQSLSPVGYVFPTDDPCPPVDVSSGQKAKECALGPAPIYTINATEPEELATGIAFAKKHNIRLVVRNTGHDILGK